MSRGVDFKTKLIPKGDNSVNSLLNTTNDASKASSSHKPQKLPQRDQSIEDDLDPDMDLENRTNLLDQTDLLDQSSSYQLSSQQQSSNSQYLQYSQQYPKNQNQNQNQTVLPRGQNRPPKAKKARGPQGHQYSQQNNRQFNVYQDFTDKTMIDKERQNYEKSFGYQLEMKNEKKRQLKLAKSPLQQRYDSHDKGRQSQEVRAIYEEQGQYGQQDQQGQKKQGVNQEILKQSFQTQRNEGNAGNGGEGIGQRRIIQHQNQGQNQGLQSDGQIGQSDCNAQIQSFQKSVQQNQQQNQLQNQQQNPLMNYLGRRSNSVSNAYTYANSKQPHFAQDPPPEPFSKNDSLPQPTLPKKSENQARVQAPLLQRAPYANASYQSTLNSLKQKSYQVSHNPLKDFKSAQNHQNHQKSQKSEIPLKDYQIPQNSQQNQNGQYNFYSSSQKFNTQKNYISIIEPSNEKQRKHQEEVEEQLKESFRRREGGVSRLLQQHRSLDKFDRTDKWVGEQGSVVTFGTKKGDQLQLRQFDFMQGSSQQQQQLKQNAGSSVGRMNPKVLFRDDEKEVRANKVVQSDDFKSNNVQQKQNEQIKITPSFNKDFRATQPLIETQHSQKQQLPAQQQPTIGRITRQSYQPPQHQPIYAQLPQTSQQPLLTQSQLHPQSQSTRQDFPRSSVQSNKETTQIKEIEENNQIRVNRDNRESIRLTKEQDGIFRYTSQSPSKVHVQTTTRSKFDQNLSNQKSNLIKNLLSERNQEPVKVELLQKGLTSLETSNRLSISNQQFVDVQRAGLLENGKQLENEYKTSSDSQKGEKFRFQKLIPQENFKEVQNSVNKHAVQGSEDKANKIENNKGNEEFKEVNTKEQNKNQFQKQENKEQSKIRQNAQTQTLNEVIPANTVKQDEKRAEINDKMRILSGMNEQLVAKVKEYKGIFDLQNNEIKRYKQQVETDALLIKEMDQEVRRLTVCNSQAYQNERLQDQEVRRLTVQLSKAYQSDFVNSQIPQSIKSSSNEPQKDQINQEDKQDLISQMDQEVRRLTIALSAQHQLAQSYQITQEKQEKSLLYKPGDKDLQEEVEDLNNEVKRMTVLYSQQIQINRSLQEQIQIPVSDSYCQSSPKQELKSDQPLISKEPKDFQESQRSKEVKNIENSQELKKPKALEQPQVSENIKDLKELKETKDPKEVREAKDSKRSKDSKSSLRKDKEKPAKSKSSKKKVKASDSQESSIGNFTLNQSPEDPGFGKDTQSAQNPEEMMKSVKKKGSKKASASGSKKTTVKKKPPKEVSDQISA